MSLLGTLTGKKSSSSTPPTSSSSNDNLHDPAATSTFQSTAFNPAIPAPDVHDFLGAGSLPDPSQLHPLAGLKQDTLDYLSLEESALSDLPGGRSAIPSRGWSDDLQYGTGVTYLSALSLGGAYGAVEGFRKLPPGSPPKLRLNSVLNNITRRGPFLGNSAGVIAMVYNIINSTIGYARGRHDATNSVVSGALSGMLFKSTRGIRPMMISGGLVASAAGAWATHIWLREKLDFPDYIAPEEYLKHWKIGRPTDDGPQENSGSATVLKRFLNDAHNEETLAYRRADIVKADKALIQEVKLEVRRRLIAAGKSQQDIEGKIGKSPTLTAMITYLYEVENPKPEGIRTIWCRVNTGLPGTDRLVPVRLLVKASLSEIYDLLRQFVYTELLCTSTKDISDQELDNVLSAWRYQPVVEKSKGRCILKDKAPVLLRHDSDYRDMIKMVRELDSKNLALLLTPVTPPSKPSIDLKPLPRIDLDEVDKPTPASGTDKSSPKTIGSPVSDTDQAWEEWLAAEGFKPVNWSEVARRIDEREDVMGSTLFDNWETLGECILETAPRQ